MSTKSWTVDADGMEHLVSLDTDASTGRTFIRVDGRMIGRPLMADEAERVFPVGSVGYVVRRKGDEFELDFAPRVAVPVTTQKRVAAAAKPKSSSPPPIVIIIIAAVALIGIAGLMGRMRAKKPVTVARKAVHWMPYTARDGSFTVNFPGEPKAEAEAEYLHNYRYTYYSFESLSDDAHSYNVEYCDLPVEISDHDSTDVLLEWLRWWMKDNNGTLVSQKSAFIDGFRGVHFMGSYAASEHRGAGVMKGDAIIANRRVFFVYADVPPTDRDIPEIAAFLASMDVK